MKKEQQQAIICRMKQNNDKAVSELIKAMRPYANDDRLFNAVDSARVIIHNLQDTIIKLSENGDI